MTRGLLTADDLPELILSLSEEASLEIRYFLWTPRDLLKFVLLLRVFFYRMSSDLLSNYRSFYNESPRSDLVSLTRGPFAKVGLIFECNSIEQLCSF